MPQTQPQPKGERILVVSPWGIGGGYCGPLTLLDRLFGEVHRRYGLRVDALYRDRGDEVVPTWVDRAFPVAAGTRLHFGRRAQIVWTLRAAAILARHAGDYHCIHLHGAYWSTLFPALFVRRTGLSLLPVLEHGDLSPGWFPRSLAQSFLRRRAVDKTVAVFCLSEGIASEARACGWQHRQLAPIGNPVGADFHPVTRAAPTKLGVRLGFAGKLGPTKQPERVLAAVAELVRTGIDASALFVGPYATSDYEARFSHQVASLGLQSRTTVTGFTDQVATHMKRDMDLFVLPSQAEGMPGALAEALSCGLPAIVTNVGEMGNVMAASQAGTVVDGSAGSIAAAVTRLLDEPGLYGRMSEKAAAYAARHYSASAVAAQFQQRLFAAMDGARPSVRVKVNSEDTCP